MTTHADRMAEIRARYRQLVDNRFVPAFVITDCDYMAARIARYESALRETHANYCEEAWRSRGLHASGCLLYELTDGETTDGGAP